MSNNNPPEAMLELSKEHAEILLASCNANLHLSLMGMMGMSREAVEKLVRNNHAFQEIRRQLMNQGIKDES